MNRIRITGSSGTGKSYLAKEISQQLGHPHLELASIYHQPNWGKPEIEEFRKKVSDFVDRDTWVIDGNHSHVSDLILSRTDSFSQSE